RVKATVRPVHASSPREQGHCLSCSTTTRAEFNDSSQHAREATLPSELKRRVQSKPGDGDQAKLSDQSKEDPLKINEGPITRARANKGSAEFVRFNDQLKYVLCILIMLKFFDIQMSSLREPDHPAVPQATIVAQFRDYHPDKFSGQGDPRIVDEWVQGLELIFEVMDCPDRYRVTCAQLQLTGDARLWWNAYWSMRPGEKEGCTWDRFKEMIREKYYPTYYRAEMEWQFLSLKQGTRSVDEYEREFTRLGAF
ncbi:Unknown protein, partial [Striga hermonthica]